MRDTINIRAEDKKDWLSVYKMNGLAFETAAEAKLVDMLREQAQPIVFLVAEKDDAIRPKISAHLISNKTQSCFQTRLQVPPKM